MGEKKPKYYAVIDGEDKTIYYTWDECEKAVNAVPGVKYKSFPNLAAAQAYLDGIDYAYEKEIKPLTEEGWLVAFTDGSFDSDWGVYSYGVVIFTPGSDKPVELCGTGRNAEHLVHRNIAGEIQGAINAIRWTEKNGYKEILIYHDYEGVGKWPDGLWKVKNELSSGYADYIKTKRQSLEIRYVWVKGHAGNTYNGRADKLARKAIEDYVKEKTESKASMPDFSDLGLGATKGDFSEALDMLIKDYPSVRCDVEEKNGVKEYVIAFNMEWIRVSFPDSGMTISGDRSQLIYTLFTSYVQKTSGRRRLAEREEAKKRAAHEPAGVATDGPGENPEKSANRTGPKAGPKAGDDNEKKD